MNPKLAHLLTRLYPRAWRQRYGVEFEALLQSGPGGLRTVANVLWSALGEILAPTPGLGHVASQQPACGASSPPIPAPSSRSSCPPPHSF